MRLTAQLAKSQLRVNRRRTLWTLAGITLSSGILSAVYGLGFGTGLDFVDRIWGDSPWIGTYLTMINGLAAILSVFIISIAIIVVSNAFRVSASERYAQFGILKSVGATQKQIVETIVFEGLYLTIIGIPLGLILGIALQFIAVEVINHFFTQIDPAGIEEMGAFLNFIVSPLSIVMSVAVSLGTVYLSAWLPAKKASKVPAINAIRGIGEVKVKNKKIWFGRLTGKVFKIEGLLASKFLKRSKGNFRATVVALSFSVILVVATGGMFTQLGRTAEMGFGGSDATVRIGFSQRGHSVETEAGWEEVRPERMMSLEEAWEMTSRLESLLGTEGDIFFMASESGPEGEVRLPLEMISDANKSFMIESWSHMDWEVTEEDLTQLWIRLVAVSPDLYLELAELAGIEPGGNILLNFAHGQTNDGTRFEFTPFNFDQQILESGRGEFKLDGQLLRDQIPVDIRGGLWNSTISVLVPEGELTQFTWLVDAPDADQFLADAELLLEEWQQEEEIDIWFSNLQASRDQNRLMMNLIGVLSFSFVGLLVAIALTNVVSTISENVRTRSKEFAVLQSIGMTREGIRRMLGLEALLSSVRALIIGLPVGVLATYALHNAMGIGFSFAFEMPWIPMGAVTIAVFIITWLTMLYAANKLKGNNIIETIRGGNG